MKKHLGLFVAAGLVCILFTFAACDVLLKAKEVVWLELGTADAKTHFLEGETFSHDGLRISAHYSDGSSAEIGLGYHVTTPEMLLTESERQSGAKTVTREVSVIYGGDCKASYSVELAAFCGIALDTEHVQKTYAQGETLSTEGLNVFEVYGDGTRIPVGSDSFAVTADMDRLGAAKACVTYEKWGRQYSASYDIAILDPNVTGIEVDAGMAPAHFYIGDEFSSLGLKVSLVMTNGERRPLEDSFSAAADGAYLGADGTFIRAGENIPVTVSYLEYRAVYFITVEELRPVSVEADSSRVKKEFFAGEELTYENLAVTVHYNSGAERTLGSGFLVAADRLDGDGKLTVDSKHVFLTYTESGVTFSEEIYTIRVLPVVLESITVSADGARKEFDVGEAFSADGIVVTAHFNSGDKLLGAGDYAVSGDVTAAAGVRTVTVSYLGETATYEVTVYNRLTGLLVADSVTEYYAGMTFHASTLTVKAVYNGGKEGAEAVGYELEGISDGEILRAVRYDVTVSYRAAGDFNRGTAEAKFSFSPKAVEAVSLTLDVSALRGRTFYRGEAHDLSGLKITVAYNYGSPSVYTVGADDAEISARFAFEEREAGDLLTVAVSWKADALLRKEFTLPLTERVVLEQIVVRGAAREDLVFSENGEFSHGSVRVLAKYSDSDAFQDVTQASSFAAPDLTRPGEATVTVSFGGMQTSYTVYVLPAQSIASLTVSAAGGANLTVLLVGAEGAQRSGRETQSWLFFEKGDAYALLYLTIKMDGWDAPIENWKLYAVDGTLSDAVSVEERDKAVVFLYGGEEFRISQTAWHWVLLGWEVSEIYLGDSVRREYTVGESLELPAVCLRYGNGDCGDVLPASEIRLEAPDGTSSVGVYTCTVSYSFGEKEFRISYEYYVIPAECADPTRRLAVTADGAGLSLLQPAVAEMPYGDEDASADGWLLCGYGEAESGGCKYLLIPYSYRYTAADGAHTFAAEGATFCVLADSLEIVCTVGGTEQTFSYDSAVWQKFVCGWRAIEEIAVNTEGAVTVFDRGSSFSAAGVTITVRYAEGEPRSETLTAHFSLRAPDMENSAEAAVVTVLFRGAEATYTVLIHELKSLLAENTVMQFTAGAPFVLGERATVKAHYDVGEDVLLPFDEEGADGYRFELQEGALGADRKLSEGEWTVTLFFRSVQTDYRITVTAAERALDRITVEGAKERFEAGEPFSSEGLTVTAYYSSGETQRIEAGDGITGYSIGSEEFCDLPGEYRIVVTYRDKSAEYFVTVLRLERLELFPTVECNRVYTTGSEYAFRNVTVTAFYDNGTEEGYSEELSEGYRVVAPDMTVAGEQQVFVLYQGASAFYTIYVLPSKLYRNAHEEGFEYHITTTPDGSGGFQNVSEDTTASLDLYITEILNGINGMGSYSYGWLLFSFSDFTYALYPFEAYYFYTGYEEYSWTAEFPLNDLLDVKVYGYGPLTVSYGAYQFEAENSEFWQKVVFDRLEEGGIAIDASGATRFYTVGQQLTVEGIGYYITDNRMRSEPAPAECPGFQVYDPEGNIVPEPYLLEKVGKYTVEFAYEYEYYYDWELSGNATARTRLTVLVFPEGFRKEEEDGGENKVAFTGGIAGSELALYVTERVTEGEVTTVKGLLLFESATIGGVLNRCYELYAFEYAFDSANDLVNCNAPGTLVHIDGDALTVSVFGVTYTASADWQTVLLGTGSH